MFNLENDWVLQPIKGDTGKAYKGVKASKKIFIKRNSTPFLAALSREGLTPKLLWTKRTSHGDVLTAQEWLDGRQLQESEIASNEDINHMLRYLHQSKSLKSMLKRMNGVEKSAFDLLQDYATNLPSELQQNTYLTKVFQFLEDNLPFYDEHSYVACHGDAIHNNWMLSQTGELYLVDWDFSVLSDPAFDLGTVLGQYVEKEAWADWLECYGEEVDDELIDRIYWYSGINLLLQIRRSYERYEKEQMNTYLSMLKKLYNYS